MRPLPHPPEAEEHADSIEVLRGWIVNGELQVSIASCWEWREQPAEWGRLLAEAAGQMADAISNETGKDRAEIYRTISESITQHLQNLPKDRGAQKYGVMNE
jgi:hypothetical protein